MKKNGKRAGRTTLCHVEVSCCRCYSQQINIGTISEVAYFIVLLLGKITDLTTTTTTTTIAAAESIPNEKKADKF